MKPNQQDRFLQLLKYFLLLLKPREKYTKRTSNLDANNLENTTNSRPTRSKCLVSIGVWPTPLTYGKHRSWQWILADWFWGMNGLCARTVGSRSRRTSSRDRSAYRLSVGSPAESSPTPKINPSPPSQENQAEAVHPIAPPAKDFVETRWEDYPIPRLRFVAAASPPDNKTGSNRGCDCSPVNQSRKLGRLAHASHLREQRKSQ